MEEGTKVGEEDTRVEEGATTTVIVKGEVEDIKEEEEVVGEDITSREIVVTKAEEEGEGIKDSSRATSVAEVGSSSYIRVLGKMPDPLNVDKNRRRSTRGERRQSKKKERPAGQLLFSSKGWQIERTRSYDELSPAVQGRSVGARERFGEVIIVSFKSTAADSRGRG